MSNPVKNPGKSGQLSEMLIQFQLRPNYSDPVPVPAPARIHFPVAHCPKRPRLQLIHSPARLYNLFTARAVNSI